MASDLASLSRSQPVKRQLRAGCTRLQARSRRCCAGYYGRALAPHWQAQGHHWRGQAGTGATQAHPPGGSCGAAYTL